MTKLSGTSLIRAAFEALFRPDGINLAAVKEFISEDYRQWVDGHELDYDAFVNHLKMLEWEIQSARVEFLELTEGQDGVFSIHKVHVEKKNGSQAVIRMLAYFKISGGKIVRCMETAQVLQGAALDRELAHRV